MRIIYFLLLFAALRTATERQEGVVSQIDQSVKEPNWDHKKYTSSRSLIMAEGATSSDDYAVFLEELSALGRILNGLTLDRQLRKGQLDLVQVVSEMAGVSVNQTLIDELAGAKWTDAEQAVQAISTQLAGFSRATWQDQKITDGLNALGTLVDKVKPTAEMLDVEKIDKFLKAVDDFNAEDFKVFDGNPAKDLLASLNAIEASTTVSQALCDTTRENVLKLENAMKAFDTSKQTYDNIRTSIETDFASISELLTVIPLLTSSSGDFDKMSSLANELVLFSGSLKNLDTLSNGFDSLSPNTELLKKFIRALSTSPTIKLTLGLPHGLADLDAISSDLRHIRNQKLISGGGNLSALESSFSELNHVKAALKKLVYEWKGLQKRSQAPIESLDSLRQQLSAFGTVSAEISQSSQKLVDFSNSMNWIITGITDKSVENLTGTLTAVHTELPKANGFFRLLSTARNEFKDLKSLSDIFDSKKFGTTVIKDNMMNFPQLTTIKANLATLERDFKDLKSSTLFSDIHTVRKAVMIPKAKLLKDWVVGVKEFQKPDGLDELLISTRKIVGDVQKLDAVSLNFVKEVIVEAQKMKTSVKSIRSQTAQSKSRAKRQVTIDGWTQLDALSSTIGHAVRSAMVLSPTDGIGGKLEQLSKASKELDDALKATADQRTRSEVENEWKGYGNIEAEASVVQNQVKKVVESVPEKLETLKDLAVVVEKMTLVYMKFTKATAAAEAVKRIPTTSGDRNVKQKVEEVQKALDETLLAHMKFAAHHAHLKMGADALESVATFFASIFGISEVHATPSTTPAEESGLRQLEYVGIGVGLVAVMMTIGFILFKRFKPKKTRNSEKVEAMSEAESLAKSFMNVRSKKSSRRLSRKDDTDKSTTTRFDAGNDDDELLVKYWIEVAEEKVRVDKEEKMARMKPKPRIKDAAGGLCANIRTHLLNHNATADKLHIALKNKIAKSTIVNWLDGRYWLNSRNESTVCQWWTCATEIERGELLQSGRTPPPIVETLVEMEQKNVKTEVMLQVFEYGLGLYFYSKQNGTDLKLKWLRQYQQRKQQEVKNEPANAANNRLTSSDPEDFDVVWSRTASPDHQADSVEDSETEENDQTGGDSIGNLSVSIDSNGGREDSGEKLDGKTGNEQRSVNDDSGQEDGSISQEMDHSEDIENPSDIEQEKDDGDCTGTEFSTSSTTVSSAGSISNSTSRLEQESKCVLIEEKLVAMLDNRQKVGPSAGVLLESIANVVSESVSRAIAKCSPILKEASKDVGKLCDDTDKLEELIVEIRALRLETQRGPPT